MPIQEVEFTLNGKKIVADVDGKLPLIRFLRDRLGLMGTKCGCGQGHCGACTVIIDGKARLSCIVSVAEVSRSEIVTIEGLARDGDLHPIQRSFIECGAIQCGFCTPGMVLSVKALLDRNPSPSDEEIRNGLVHNYCRCGSYLRIVDAVKRASILMKGQTPHETERYPLLPIPTTAAGGPIGASIIKKDAFDKVSGVTQFVDDQHMEGMLYGKVLWSEYPHARILSMDTDVARNLPGVVCILTHQDVPGLKEFGTLIPDQPVFASERVRSVGDAVAAVFAEDEETAQRAVNLIQVEFQPLEVVSDPRRALEPDAPILHEGGNILIRKSLVNGDVEEGFAKSDVIIENSYTTPFVEHAYLEPESGIAVPTQDGGIEIRMATQCPHRDLNQIAPPLGLPLDKVRIVQTPIGGAFGGREDITLQIILGLGAYHTKRPTKITLSRKESLRASTKKHAFYMNYKTGATRDGRLTAQEIRIIGDTGAYASTGSLVLEQALIFSCGPYVVPHVRGEAMAVYTNNLRCGAMRGFGINQVAFAVESQMNLLARKLGIDPFELRLINALDRGKRTAAGQLLKESVGIKDTLIEAQKSLNSTPMPKVKGKLGIGVASAYKNVGMGLGSIDSSGAAMELKANGRVTLRIGTSDMGQGADTVMAQFAAHALEFDYDSIDVISADTLIAPYGGPTIAQRGTYVTGNAVLRAGDQFKKLLIRRVADEFGFQPSEVNFSKGVFTETKTGRILLTLAELARTTVVKGERLSAETMYKLPKTYPLHTVYQPAIFSGVKHFQIPQHRGNEPSPDSDEYQNYNCYSFVTHVAVVEVDEKTGAVKVHKIIAAHDSGKSLNPLIALGQIEGSVMMGLGYGLSEEFIMKDGLMVTDTLAKCRIPSFREVPEITTIIVENPEPGGPLGAKGISEVAALPTAPAILNAIYNATGAHITSLPATRNKVLETIQKLEKSSSMRLWGESTLRDLKRAKCLKVGR